MCLCFNILLCSKSEWHSHGIQSHQFIEVSVPYAIGGMKNQVFAIYNPDSMLYFQCRNQIDLKYASKCFIFYAPTSNHSPSIIPCHAGRWTLYGIAGFSLIPIRSNWKSSNGFRILWVILDFNFNDQIANAKYQM